MTKRYYAADNKYSSSTDIGFSNTWYVLVFDSKAARDSYVENARGLAARAIKRAEVIGYAKNWNMSRNEYNAPKPFSFEYWGIADEYEYWDKPVPDGYVGHVTVCSPYGYHNKAERFYK